MSTKSLGKVTVTPRGEWDETYAYKRLDIVSGSGASWICIADTTAGTAVTDADHWMKLAGKGEDLKAVSSAKTGTSGAVDTYTLTFTFSDDSTDTVTYTVTNGSVTSVAGKTGAVTLGAGDVGYDATASYTSATVGGEVSALKSAINDIENSIGFEQYNGTSNILETTGIIGKTLAQVEQSTYTTVIPLDWSNGDTGGTFKLTLVMDNSGDYTPSGSFVFQPLNENKSAQGSSYNISQMLSGVSLSPTYHKYLQITAYADRSYTITKLGLTKGAYEEYEIANEASAITAVAACVDSKGADIFDGNYTAGMVNVVTGEYTSTSTTKVTDYLPAVAGKTLVSSYSGAKNEMFLCACFDAEQNIIPEPVQKSGDGTQRSSGYFVLPTGCAYVRVTFINDNAKALAKIYLLDSADYAPENPRVKWLNGDNGEPIYYIDLITKNNLTELLNATSKRFFGKKIVAFGDSVTNGAAWFAGVRAFFGSQPVNLGVPGSTVIDLSNGFCTDARIADIPTDADLILIMGGINDWASNVALGDKTVTNTDTTKFYGAVNVMLQKMMTRVPDATIICMGATYGVYPNKTGFDDTTGIYNNLGLSTLDYGMALADMCRLNGFESFVVGEECGWNINNISTYVTNDGAYLHPNATGGARMAEVINRKIG